MNPIRYIYPLRLRQSLFCRLNAGKWSWPIPPTEDFALHFAPARLRALVSTDLTHRQIAHLGFYELELSRKLSSLARQGGLLVDVGANVGYFTCLWTAINSTNTAYAFEPSPRNVDLLEQNVNAQQFKERVTIFATALGKKSGEAHFDPGPTEQTGWGGLAASATKETVRVMVQRLDEIIPKDTEIAVLKVDTEGADVWVCIRHVFCERNPARMQALGIVDGTIEQLLRTMGYAFEYLDGSRCAEIHAFIQPY